MPNKIACKNRLLLSNDSRYAVLKDCFAAVLSVSGLIVTASTAVGQSDHTPPDRVWHENVNRSPSQSNLPPSASNYLPASPWSKRVSYEQPITPDQLTPPQTNVLKQPSKKPLAEKVADRPAGLSWGRIREIQPQEKSGSEPSSRLGALELADVSPAQQSVNHSTEEPTQTLDVIPPVGFDTQTAEIGNVAVAITKESGFDEPESEGLFLVPPSPHAQAPHAQAPHTQVADSQGIGHFASTRGTMTRSKPVVVPAEPESFSSTSVSQPSIQEAERMRIAQMQSHELQSIPLGPVYAEPRLLESPVGWKAIRGELAKHLENCDSLLRRGATHSARAEVLVGLRKLFRIMDLYRGVTHSETCFEAALTAMREESDFHNLQMSRSVASIVAMHTTPALKNRPLESVTAELACQHYRAYARFQLAQAADGHLYAADLLYALGKTLEKDADLNSDRAQQLRSQAVICYQTAIQLRPNQHHASNQLGYALIHLDRIEEAYDALRSSIEVKPNAPAWTNLAEIYRRRGATTEANYAVQQAMALGGGEPTEQLDITQVDPAVFAKFSPAHNANSVPSPVASQGTSPGPAYQQTVKAGNFFTKMFR